MITGFAPMLAGKLSKPERLQYPVLASPKLDGIRCCVVDGKPMSRNLKLIPNRVIRDILSGLPCFDGELVIGAPTGQDVFNRTSSGVMSVEGAPKVTYHVFDVVLNARLPFNERLALATQWAASGSKVVQPVRHKLIKTEEALLAYEERMLQAGYEGVMLRSLDGPYKFGRSTEREGYLLKLKRFEDSEAEVLGFVEKMHNDNELTQDELGRAKRSSHKAGKRAAGTLGALEVRDVETGAEFQVGSGFTDAQRASIWASQADLMGKLVKYRFQPTGVKDKPRFPTFLGWRDAADLS